MHAIRLAGPWETLDFTTSEWQKTRLPVAARPQETTSLCRKFHRPTGLSASTRVFVQIESTAPVDSVRVNDLQVGGSPANRNACRYDVTEGLKPFNTLHIVLGAGAGKLQSVCLLIDES